MIAKIEGNFVENKIIQKKDGSQLEVACVLAGDEVVQINDCSFPGLKKLEPVIINVEIKQSQYGLIIRPSVNNIDEGIKKNDKQ